MGATPLVVLILCDIIYVYHYMPSAPPPSTHPKHTICISALVWEDFNIMSGCLTRIVLKSSHANAEIEALEDHMCDWGQQTVFLPETPMNCKKKNLKMNLMSITLNYMRCTIVLKRLLGKFVLSAPPCTVQVYGLSGCNGKLKLVWIS